MTLWGQNSGGRESATAVVKVIYCGSVSEDDVFTGPVLQVGDNLFFLKFADKVICLSRCDIQAVNQNRNADFAELLNHITRGYGFAMLSM